VAPRVSARRAVVSPGLNSAVSSREQALSDRSRQEHHEPTTSARQAAEALFRPKRQLAQESIQEGAPREGAPPASVSVRKPRVLTISPTQPLHHGEPETPIIPEKQVAPEIPRSQFARIRAWAKYGMTARQVAEVYGVTVGEIEGILRKGGQRPVEQV
jgi:hypothetical protein